MAKSSDEPKVTRIKAKDTGSTKAAKTVKPAKQSKSAVKAVVAEADDNAKENVFRRLGGYFKGSWHELTQVRWPDRKSTWKMTGALIAFTLTFTAVILLLDYAFQYVFQIIIGK